MVSSLVATLLRKGVTDGTLLNGCDAVKRKRDSERVSERSRTNFESLENIEEELDKEQRSFQPPSFSNPTTLRLPRVSTRLAWAPGCAMETLTITYH
jgi:hypothetical protein